MPSRPKDVPEREVTPKQLYLTRRNFLRAGLVGASMAGTGLIYRQLLMARRAGRGGKPIDGVVRSQSRVPTRR